MPNTTTRRQAARDPLDHDPVALRARRVSLGLRQYEVANTARISKGTLSELERGTRNPSPVVLRQLAEALQCTIADLMPARRAA